MRRKQKSNVEKCIKLLDDAHDVYSDILYYESLRINGDDEKKKIADNMGAKIVRYKTIDEAVEKGAVISIMVNSDSYITEEERKILESKINVGK